MDPITIPDDIPLNSVKVLLDWYRQKPIGKKEALAAALTVLAYAGSQAIDGFFSPSEGMGSACWSTSDAEQALESLLSGGEKAGIIPWDVIARAVVKQLLEHFGL